MFIQPRSNGGKNESCKINDNGGCLNINRRNRVADLCLGFRPKMKIIWIMLRLINDFCLLSQPFKRNEFLKFSCESQKGQSEKYRK